MTIFHAMYNDHGLKFRFCGVLCDPTKLVAEECSECSVLTSS